MVERACKCQPGRGEPPYFYRDDDGYLTCKHCDGILNYMGALTECDICGNLFKGFKKFVGFPYTGPCCE